MSALQFLQDNIDAEAKIKPLKMKDVLSPAMNSRYAFRQLDLLGDIYLLASPNGQFTSKGLMRDFAEVELKTKQSVILYTETLSAYNKKKLISERIPFLLFDKQIFLPALTLSISSRRSDEFVQRGILTPAAQAAFLFILYAEEEIVGQQEIQKSLDISAITASRAVAELRSLNLIEVQTGGKTNRKQEIRVSDRQDFYRNGMGYFGRATKQSIFCKGKPDRKLLLGGLSALSKRSMINPPKQRSYVYYSRKIKSLDLQQIAIEEYFDTQDAFRVDLINYDPTHLALDGMADPVTMMLTLHERDERVDAELNNYMRGFSWYTD